MRNPSSLKTFKMKKSPNTVASLSLGIQEVDMRKMDDPKAIPSLDMSRFIRLCISTSVTKLSLPAKFNQPLPLSSEWKSHLTTLVFGACFNQSLSNLPDTVQRIGFRAKHPHFIEFNQPVSKLPLDLKELTFDGSSKFNQPLCSLPAGLRVIRFTEMDDRIFR